MTTVDRSNLAPDDAAFLAAFESATIPASAFPHRAHLRMTWLYLRQLDSAVAEERIVSGIRRLAGSHGHPALFHETLTRAWVRLVAAEMGGGEATDFDGFLRANPHLLEKGLPLRHYSPHLLWSEGARARWCEPDLRPLPEPRRPARRAAVTMAPPSTTSPADVAQG